MNFLLDTCTFLWLADNAPQLSPAARETFLDPANTFYFSAASAAEICIKVSIGKLHLRTDPQRLIEDEQAKNALLLLPFSQVHAFHLITLPPIHKDPFDRMLITQALSHTLTLLTPPPLIRQYPVPTL